jgi:adhesin transport system outer membrane protein
VLNTENELFEAKRASARARYDLTQAELRVLTQTHRILPSMQLASVAKQGPEEAGATEPAEDETLQCSTELPRCSPSTPSAPCVAAPAHGAAAARAHAAGEPGFGHPPAAATPAIEPLVKAWAAAWTART